MEKLRVGKATAVCLRHRDKTSEVLVFDHPLDEGGFMIQLPAGTIEEGEEPAVAAGRELREETGVEATPAAFVGIRDEEWDGEARRRWIYLFDAPADLPDEWPFSCDCGAKTRCRWLPFDSAEIYEPQQPWLQMARQHFYSTSDSNLPEQVGSTPPC